MQLPTDTFKIERVIEEASVVLHIVIFSPHDQFIMEKQSGRIKNNELSTLRVQTMQQFCEKFDSHLYSIVSDKYTLPIEKRLMVLKWDDIRVNNSGSTDHTYGLDSFEQEDKPSLCLPSVSVDSFISSFRTMLLRLNNSFCNCLTISFIETDSSLILSSSHVNLFAFVFK
ncbi:unnamed protein product [Didymodactylos carnosus]|uniref:Uncharacterized protein n=1 Tax=Didymodactylos carnosus TaxID=1234261 RepID=A0A815CYI3_9BILA|nr:unnamed protein product [Didymodactylos carnosus]CAF1290283.1 unnamed protein product [Didymodactylos carnosus]CAF3868544.1 unnamed protein product [Didymodactylos carnosus]CAF4095653.1 unnamed protein product [Didymodactylos carnosus]